MLVHLLTGRKDYIRLNARDGESISISNAAIGADTTESLKNAVGTYNYVPVCVCVRMRGIATIQYVDTGFVSTCDTVIQLSDALNIPSG